MADKHARGRALDSARAAKKVSAQETEKLKWLPPKREDCDRTDTIPMPISATTRIVQVLSYVRNKIVYYAMTHEVFDSGDWRKVVRIDCSHGTVHVHHFTRTGVKIGEPTQMESLHSEEDVPRTYEDSYNHILDNVEEHERRWRQ
ncbi:hypothetical protein [Pseudolysinimonas sp.]|jgi:hypothetical protein|uniref:DUF7718 family protein n=1 Tax=Pseudolysinimonas sp. TaxID=2680009 RepID=UPI003782F99C